MFFADVIRRELHARRLSQQWLAERLGTTRQRVNRLLQTSDKMPFGMVLRIAVILELSLDDIVSEDRKLIELQRLAEEPKQLNLFD